MEYLIPKLFTTSVKLISIFMCLNRDGVHWHKVIVKLCEVGFEPIVRNFSRLFKPWNSLYDFHVDPTVGWIFYQIVLIYYLFWYEINFNECVLVFFGLVFHSRSLFCPGWYTWLHLLKWYYWGVFLWSLVCWGSMICCRYIPIYCLLLWLKSVNLSFKRS